MNNDKTKPKHNTYVFSFLPPIIIHNDGAFYRTPTYPSLPHQQLLPSLEIFFQLVHLFLICVFVATIPSLSFKPISTSTYPTKFKHVLRQSPLATCSTNNLQRTIVFSSSNQFQSSIAPHKLTTSDTN
jgi:hypothetical protein